MSRLRGSMVALVTPFRGGAVDEAALRDLARWQIDNGTDGLVPCGTTGEGATLSGDELFRVVRACVEEARGRVPVIAGCGTIEGALDVAVIVTVWVPSSPTPAETFVIDTSVAAASSRTVWGEIASKEGTLFGSGVPTVTAWSALKSPKAPTPSLDILHWKS